MRGATRPELEVAADLGKGTTQPSLLPGAVVQLFLFHGDRYLGWDCFAKDMVLVGGEPEDDLTLDGLSGSGTRLVVYVDEGRLVVHDPSGTGAVRVNDEPITTRVLGSLDVVTIGGYSLKARLEQMGSGAMAPEEPEAPEPEPAEPHQASVGDWLSFQPAPEPEPTEPHQGSTGEWLSFHAAQEPEPATATPETQRAPAPITDPALDLVPVPEVLPQETAPALEPQPDAPELETVPPEGLDDPHALELFHALVEQAAGTTEEAPAQDVVRVEFNAPIEEEAPVAPEPDLTPSPVVATLPEPAAPELKPDAPPRQPPAATTEEALPPDVVRVEFDAPLPTAEPEPATQMRAPSAPPAQPLVEQPLLQPLVEATPPEAPRPTVTTTWTMPKPAFVPDDEPDEDEEEDREASFSLVDLALWNPTPDPREELDGVMLQVVRTRGGELLDLALLDHDQRYRHPASSRRSRALARRDKAGRSFLTLNRTRSAGQMLLADGRRVPLADFLTPETRVSRRSELHRVALPQGSQAHLQVDGEELVIHEVPRRRSPEIEEAPAKKGGLVRNLASSSLVHVVLLMVGSLFISLSPPEEPPPLETRFVQLDLEQLKPPAPKPPEAKPKPKPAAPVQVAKAVKAKPKPAAAPKPTTKKTKPGPNPALASNKGKGPNSAAASPNAGGGHGGNARNRNIKKAGILGALGIPDGINLGATQAMAAVTNIDSVRSTRSSEAGLKVGGIVGNLGSGRIEMPAVGLVNTKGSTQVVVSAGIGGSGSVAALERGKTGETQVRAMVTADIKVPASVSGGMSREEVKRVIDDHMDEVSYCYETALIEDAGLMGRMAFEWKIMMSGRVGEVAIQSSSIQSDPLHACIKRAIKTWQFPQPRGAEVLVSYPFVFDVVGF